MNNLSLKPETQDSQQSTANKVTAILRERAKTLSLANTEIITDENTINSLLSVINKSKL